MRRWAPVGLAVLLVSAGALVLGARSHGQPVTSEPVERVLVISLPGVAWEDVRDHDLPNLERFVARSAIGDLATRIDRRRTTMPAAYLSMGAGTRSLAPVVDAAVALDPDETYGGISTADILLRRLGHVPDGVAYLAAGAAADLNAEGPFGGRPGRLGDLLADAGVRRAVIANADAAEGFVSDEPPPEGAFARSAATLLMGSDGIVPDGTVARALLQPDPLAPFGRRYAPDAVLTAFDQVWSAEGPVVALVEASDLTRASGYGPRSTPGQRRALHQDALRTSDELLGSLLDRVDLDRDAVLVLSPVSPRTSPELSVVALSTPTTDSGVLRSSTTRRDGYVQLADVMPTILHLVGLEAPDDIEGRPFEVSDRPAAPRVDELATEAAAAGFRDSVLPLLVTLVTLGLALLVLVAWRAERLPTMAVRAVRPAALFALGVVPATYFVAQIPALFGGTGAYLAGVAALAGLLAGVATIVDRRRPGLGVLVSLGVIVATFSLDVALGTPLQVNAPFGYSVAVAGRFAGIGNLAFALFGAAAIALSVLIVRRYGQDALPWSTALLVAVVMLEGLPMLGADVGGVMSMVPAFGVTLLLLAGRRPVAGTIAALVVASALAVLAFAFVDAARPAGDQTHLARVAEHLLAGRWDAFGDTFTRRLQASFGGVEVAAWAFVIALIVSVGVYVVLGPRWRARDGAGLIAGWRTRRPALALLAGATVLAALGLVANDSSIAVPATMLIVLVPVGVLHARPIQEATAQ